LRERKLSVFFLSWDLSQRKAASPRLGYRTRELGGALTSPGCSSMIRGRFAMKLDLAACYRQEWLPRNTSYPAAPHFSSAIGPDTYAEWLQAIPPHASASLYLHVPFCRYCGQDAPVTGRDQPIAVYESALRCEVDLVSRHIDRRIKVDCIHLGGGTPTTMAPASFTDLIGSIRHAFFVLPSAEIAVEIDPRTLTRRMIDALAYGGVNRANLGVPSFDPVVQRAIGLVQNFQETAAAAKALRRAGIAGINFDLGYGLPYQTIASCLDTVRRCVEIRPDRLSLFSYEQVPAFKQPRRRIDTAGLPDSCERNDQYHAIANVLKQAGYQQIGLDRFALVDDEMALTLREGKQGSDFQDHTIDVGDVLLGFGAGAIGRLPQGYVQNEVQTHAYAEKIACGGLATVKGYALTGDDRRRAEIIERIMGEFGADLDRICARDGSVPEAMARSSPRRRDPISDGMLELDGVALALTE
jgi:oxygen-independent coproporphyrinogen III oxidase